MKITKRNLNKCPGQLLRPTGAAIKFYRNSIAGLISITIKSTLNQPLKIQLARPIHDSLLARRPLFIKKSIKKNWFEAPRGERMDLNGYYDTRGGLTIQPGGESEPIKDNQLHRIAYKDVRRGTGFLMRCPIPLNDDYLKEV